MNMSSIQKLSLEHLGWPNVTNKLASLANTDAAKGQCMALLPTLSEETIRNEWEKTFQVREVITAGYTAPIPNLPVMDEALRGAKLGQLFTGEDLRLVYSLVTATIQVNRFLHDLKEKCPFFRIAYTKIFPVPKLRDAIERSIDEAGIVKDDATPKLKSIRQAKISLRKTIENQIRQLLINNEWETYIQDKFFTIRRERYVIPIRIDGRGRVKGSIYDTSDSGQTLYIEPPDIAPLNENLLELEVSDKLEVAKILRELSAHVSSEYDSLNASYFGIVELDAVQAKARLAYETDSYPVQLASAPVLDLKRAFHPLVKSPSGEKAVANDILLTPEQKCLIISGPNAGGKTVVLKTVGIIHLMAKAGLLLPAHPSSQVYLFSKIYVSMGDSQDLVASLSTFSGHLLHLKPVLEQVTDTDLVLVDELAVGTEPQTGSAIAQSVLEHFASKNVTSLATTHFDSLKGIALVNNKFRNGSLEFLTKSLQPTYNLVLDVPGQSYGIELAEHLGIPAPIIKRARQLKGSGYNEFDDMIKKLAENTSLMNEEKAQVHALKMDLEAQKAHWERERQNLEKIKEDARAKASRAFESKQEALSSEFNEALAELKELLKKARKAESPVAIEDELVKQRTSLKQKWESLSSEVSSLAEQEIIGALPGTACTAQDLSVGDQVYVISLKNEATVLSVAADGNTVEVQAGLLKLKPAVTEIRLLEKSKATPKKAGGKSTTLAAESKKSKEQIGLVITSPTNSLDVRGLDAELALEKLWQFIDKGVLRGEPNLVVVHGHGTDKLKKEIRAALAKTDLYQLDFRPGLQEEGGDGVTIIRLTS
ncbi:MAG: endonuclease MutS2 [Oligoflexales bacterium]